MMAWPTLPLIYLTLRNTLEAASGQGATNSSLVQIYLQTVRRTDGQANSYSKNSKSCRTCQRSNRGKDSNANEVLQGVMRRSSLPSLHVGPTRERK